MQKYLMYLNMIFQALMRRKARMAVALLAVAVGATIISGMITVYREVPEQMGRAFRAYGANVLLLPSGETANFSEADLAKAREALKGYELVGLSPFLYETVTVNHQMVTAGGADFKELQAVSPYWQIDGEWPTDSEREILVGSEFASQLRLEVGKTVTVSGGEGELERDFVVTGIVRTGGKEESCVYVPLHELQSLKGKPGVVSLAQLSIVSDEAGLTAAEEKLSAAGAGFTAQSVKQIARSEGTVLGKLQALVLLVTVVVLVLTLICVSTTMMAVVTERRREIGLKKALGATNFNIVMDFLGEGCLLGFFGGVLGSGAGFVFAQSVSVNVFGRGIEFAPGIAILSLVLSIVITGLASLVPVRIATSVNPAIVLRGE